MTSNQRTRVILVGVGGATCSGKTTLAKHLKSIIPDSVIIHQDPQADVPIHPIYKVQDWDAAPGAIQWTKFIQFLRQIKATGTIPPEHRSHDHLNEQKLVEISEDVRNQWIDVFQRIRKEQAQKGERIIWGLVDGFLMYWNQVWNVNSAQVQSDPEGSLWRDPPGYWEQIVYPAYIDAHRDVFIDGDVEEGLPGTKVKGLVVIRSLELGMDEAVSMACRELENVVL
ncbi:hypothetical protein H0H92_002320 [Tricholoma furcatifolium]|nr:hypothetical protein H0H92_002320 [Tricholoma furcatifolium]